MKIAIDIDGVLTDMEAFEDEFGREYFGYEVLDKTGYDVDERFKVSKKECDTFWDKYFYQYVNSIIPRDDASRITHKLHEDGNKIYIITSRVFYPQYGFKTKEDLTNSTLRFLNDNDIYFDEYIETKDPKVESSIDNKIDIFIEDSPRNIKSLSKVTNVIIFDSNYNKFLDTFKYHAKDWNQVYEIIKNLKKN